MVHSGRQERQDTKRKPGQFTVGFMLFLFSGLCLSLALATQLKYVGLVLSSYVAATAIGLWIGKWRLASAGLAAALVFAFICIVSWAQMGNETYTNIWQVEHVHDELREIERALEEHAAANGSYPVSLADLQYHSSRYRQSDPWGHAYHYVTTDHGFELGSLGRDGRHDGSGLDADILLSSDASEFNQFSSHLPLKQFLLETPVGVAVFVAALLASLAAGFIWYDAQVVHEPRLPQMVVGFLIAVLLAVFLGVLLIAFHLRLAWQTQRPDFALMPRIEQKLFCSEAGRDVVPRLTPRQAAEQNKFCST